MSLKELRLKKNINQVTISRYFGIPLRTLQHWEAGDRVGSEYMINRLYACLKSIKEDQMLIVGYVNQDNDFFVALNKQEAIAMAREAWSKTQDKEGKRIVSGVFSIQMGEFTGLYWEIFEVLY